jgi:hypothetical protein
MPTDPSFNDPANIRRSAGLPLSVGAASLALRVFIAAMFLIVGVLCLASGGFVGRTGGVPASVIAILLIVPFGLIACTAALYTIAPFSRFGVWLDHFLPTLGSWRGGLVAVLLWLVSGALLFGIRALMRA